MKTLKIFFLFVFVMEFSQLNSQNLKQNRLPCLNKTYYIVYHPVMIGNNSQFPIKHIDSGVILVNKLLEPICIEFKVLDTIKLTNYNYNVEFSKLDITKEYFRDEMARMNNVKDVINLYHMDAEIAYEEAGICKKNEEFPFLSIPNNRELSVFALNLSRLLINYLGLKLTPFYPFNKELVNGSNSQSTADLLVETPSDPFFILNPPSDPTISFTNGIKYMDYDKKDANNEYYSAMIYNIMSFYPLTYYEACNKLTYQQYDYIVKTIKTCP